MGVKICGAVRVQSCRMSSGDRKVLTLEPWRPKTTAQTAPERRKAVTQASIAPKDSPSRTVANKMFHSIVRDAIADATACPRRAKTTRERSADTTMATRPPTHRG